MTSSNLPIIESVDAVDENWDCHGCGVCCRGTTVLLGEDDLQRIREQRWEAAAEFKHPKTVVRSAGAGGKFVLAKQSNGDCVFLDENSRCRIHKKFGGDAKPAVCRMFPFHLVPTESGARLTAKRSCPSAATDRGQPISEQTIDLKRAGLLKQFSPRANKPLEQSPPVAQREYREWAEFETAADTIAKIVNDENLPMVRRIVHALEFCDLLSECKLNQVQSDGFDELIGVLEDSCSQNAGDWFRDRQAPTGGAKSLLRQTAAHYLRSHPKAVRKETVASRLSAAWQSLVFVRGRGKVPSISADFPTTTFTDLDRALGPLPPDVSKPLDRYLSTQTLSRQYAFVEQDRSLVDSFRCLALAYPLAMWMLRLIATEREPETSDMVDIVVAIERGQGLSSLTRLVKSLSQSEQLKRLVVWCAR